MPILKYSLLFILVVFILPAVATFVWWSLQDRPQSHRDADWSASGVLPAASADRDAAIYVMAARTGGLKGAFAVHSWVVLKRQGDRSYDRYDKVGWGTPVRLNARPADGRWYSNMPAIVCEAHGKQASSLIPSIEAAIKDYPYSKSGDYHIWPGPNSNSFIAHVVKSVPELGACLPPNAAGRDYAPGWFSAEWSKDGANLHVTMLGLAGFAVGRTVGFELHFMGLVAGIDWLHPALKIPAFGRVSLTG